MSDDIKNIWACLFQYGYLLAFDHGLRDRKSVREFMLAWCIDHPASGLTDIETCYSVPEDEFYWIANDVMEEHEQAARELVNELESPENEDDWV